MKYIMVTDFDKHWDKIEKNFTSYSTNMIKQKISKGKFDSGTETIFIKKEKYTGIVEKSWIGQVTNIQVLPGKVYFSVEIEKEIPCPQEYSDWPNGWYFE